MSKTINCINWNNQLINKVNCPYCNYSLYKNCFQNILLNQILVWYCPNCNKQFDFNFLFNNFSEDFIKNNLQQNYVNFLRYFIDYNTL